MVRFWFNRGTSIHTLSRMFRISRRSIQFKLFPERKKKDLENRKDRGGSMIYYNKDTWKEVMKKHRKYKHKLLK